MIGGVLRKLIVNLIVITMLLTIFSYGIFAEMEDYEIESGKIYLIQNVGTGLNLDIKGSSQQTGESIITNSGILTESSKWQVNVEKVVGDETYISLISHSSHYTLTENEGHYIQAEYNGTNDQLFRLIKVDGEGKYKLISVNGMAIKSAEVGDSQSAESLIAQTDSEDNSIYWEFIELNDKKGQLEMMRYWAPNVYQDFNGTYDFLWKYDYITAFDFDGDWRGNNNWENADSGSKVPYVYTSIQETNSHYFITYNFFHPRDVGNILGNILAADSHENDMEGALFVVRKSADFGELEAVYTIQHGGYGTYTGSDIKYGANGKVNLFISSNGPAVSGNGISQHGHCVHMWDGSNAEGGILYTYNQQADENGALSEALWTPSQDNEFVQFDYGLLSLDELWSRRFEIGEGNTFNKYGNFDGDSSSVDGMGTDSANAPWKWEKGLWISDPAFFSDEVSYFATMSHNYIFNKYFSHKIVVDRVQAHSYKDPYNPFYTKSRKPDIFIRVTGADTKFIDIGDWKVSNLNLNVWRDFNFGKDEAEGGNKFMESFSYIYIAKGRDLHVDFEARDRDDDADDTMGTVTKSTNAGNSLYFTERTSNGDATIEGALHVRVE